MIGEAPTPKGEYKTDIENIMKFVVSKSNSKTNNHKLRGNAKIVDNYIYFSIHHFRKNNDYRYITKSELYKYDLETKQIQLVKDFKKEAIISYDNNRILLIYYDTVYQYDLNTNKMKKVCKINISSEIAYDEYKGIVRIWSKKNYFISPDGTLSVTD